MQNPFIINAKEEKEPFSFNKVKSSAKRAGAPDKLAEKIALDIKKRVRAGDRTSDIFNQIKIGLNQESPASAMRFDLKSAMRKLGPTGFPFEKYIAQVFSEIGFDTQLNPRLKGRAIDYEIDFVAKQASITKIGECKYHNLPKLRIHAHTILENHAKFIDIQNGQLKTIKNVSGIIVTNTKFSDRAMQYAKSVNLELLGWNFPKNRGLERIIESKKLYPITILPSLTPETAEFLSQNKMMLAKDLLKTNNKNLKKLQAEARTLFE